MSEADFPFVRRHAAVLLTVVLGLAVGLLLIRGVAGFLADSRYAQVEGAWKSTLGSFDEILERHPPRDVNDSALGVEGLGATLGVDLAPTFVEDRARPTEEDARGYHDLKRELGSYLNAQLERSGSDAAALPRAVEQFLDRHTSEIDGLRRGLIDHGVPRWELQMEKLAAAPIPNLRGHLDLQRILIADAFRRADEGDAKGAAADLEASWRLNAGLRDDPILSTQLIALSVSRMQLAVLRHVDPVGVAWRERLYEHDYRGSLLAALRYEAWVWTAFDEPAAYAMTDAPWTKFMLTVARPYVRFCAADVSDAWRKRLIFLSEIESYCDQEPDDGGFDQEFDLPPWNFLARISDPDLVGVIGRLGRYELDRELTAKLIEARASRARHGGVWPQTIAGIDRSRSCPSGSWEYEVDSDGAMSLAFSRPVEIGQLKGATLPLRYTSAP